MVLVCPLGHFLPLNVLYMGRFVLGRFVFGRFVLGHFVLGRFVLGSFVLGRFVCALCSYGISSLFTPYTLFDQK